MSVVGMVMKLAETEILYEDAYKEFEVGGLLDRIE
jgi:hypothetical protein